MFKKLEGDQVLLRTRGVYKPTELYEFDGKLFAKSNGGFIRLNQNGSTSQADTSIDFMRIERIIYADRFGNLCTEEASDRKPLKVTSQGRPEPLQITQGVAA